MAWIKILSLLALLSLILLLASGLGKDPKMIPSPLVGREAPDFALQLFEGGALQIKELKGNVVIVNFWASWCYPACWNEAPRIEAAWQKYKDQGILIMGVVYQDSEKNAREFIERFGKTYPVGLDSSGRISIDYGVYGVPETFFIDREGKIAYKNIGEMSMEVLTTKIEQLLQK